MYGNFINLDLQHKNTFFVTRSQCMPYSVHAPKYVSQSLFYYFKECGPSLWEHFLSQQPVSSTLHLLSFTTVWKALVLLPTFNNNQYISQIILFIKLFYWIDS